MGEVKSGLQAGSTHDPVHAEIHYHHPPDSFKDRLETPPNPFSNSPFCRDADFVDRKTILDRIHLNCAILGLWTVIVGLGDIWKPQLTIEYTHRIRERPPDN
ncbi:hypothetical protein CC78DRAFT_585697 [Lojkania enalia]|uniref:Uncharacterized protein n=1 Tax=Lojkania enalia TaxID=147567 RepID=A0A9P4N2F4_9PLEO|nr:hypothetical protein CC78DRAFT_585697 [Didymosphaeria enalia]